MRTLIYIIFACSMLERSIFGVPNLEAYNSYNTYLYIRYITYINRPWAQGKSANQQRAFTTSITASSAVTLANPKLHRYQAGWNN